MKFVTFRKDARESVGLLDQDRAVVFDLTAHGVAGSMLELIKCFEEKRSHIDSVLVGPAYQIEAVEILAPIPVPRRNIFCVGKNYREHAVEFGRSGFDAGSIGDNEVPRGSYSFHEAAIVGDWGPTKQSRRRLIPVRLRRWREGESQR